MKKLLVALVLISSSTFAQKCDNYYLLQNNKTIEMSIYNKKGEITGKQVYAVSGLNSSGGDVTANVKSEMFDKKGKSISSSTNTIKCSNGVMMMNMKMLMPQQQQQPATEAEVTAEGVYIDYPSSMNVGETLKDALLSLDMNNNGMKQSISMNITNRKIEGKEQVVTPAGSWEAYKISYSGKMTIKTMGFGIPVNMTGTEWFAPGFGVVRTETSLGKTEITAIR